jgi:hypothetical protein
LEQTLMLTRNAPKTIPAHLKITGQGDVVEFDLVYHNRTLKEYRDNLSAEGNTLGDTILFLVESWDSDFPLTMDGLTEAEEIRPGLCAAIIEGWYDARKVAREKN